MTEQETKFLNDLKRLMERYGVKLFDDIDEPGDFFFCGPDLVLTIKDIYNETEG